MRNYTPDKYRKLVNEIDDEIFQRYMADEQQFVAGIEDAKEKTFVDLGAGEGRVEPFLSSIARDVVAIEINPAMHKKLAETANSLPNVRAVNADFIRLSEILPVDLNSPVFLILLNSLGTIEGGDYQDAISVVTEELAKRNGQLVLSLLRQPVLATWGVNFYNKISAMSGRLNKERSDFDRGIIVTDTGYTSKWWTDAEIEEFKRMGRVVREKTTVEYELLELGFGD